MLKPFVPSCLEATSTLFPLVVFWPTADVDLNSCDFWELFCAQKSFSCAGPLGAGRARPPRRRRARRSLGDPFGGIEAARPAVRACTSALLWLLRPFAGTNLVRRLHVSSFRVLGSSCTKGYTDPKTVRKLGDVNTVHDAGEGLLYTRVGCTEANFPRC